MGPNYCFLCLFLAFVFPSFWGSCFYLYFCLEFIIFFSMFLEHGSLDTELQSPSKLEICCLSRQSAEHDVKKTNRSTSKNLNKSKSQVFESRGVRTSRPTWSKRAELNSKAVGNCSVIWCTLISNRKLRKLRRKTPGRSEVGWCGNEPTRFRAMPCHAKHLLFAGLLLGMQLWGPWERMESQGGSTYIIHHSQIIHTVTCSPYIFHRSSIDPPYDSNSTGAKPTALAGPRVVNAYPETSTKTLHDGFTTLPLLKLTLREFGGSLIFEISRLWHSCQW